MKRNIKLILLSFFVLTISLFSQSKFTPHIKEFTFGKAVDVKGISLPFKNKAHLDLQKKFYKHAFFNNLGVYCSIGKEYDTESIEQIFLSDEILELNVSNPIIKLNEGGYTVVSIGKEGKTIRKKIGLSSFNLSHLFMFDIVFNNTLFLTDFHVSDIVMIQKTEFIENVFFASSDFITKPKKEKQQPSYYLITNQFSQPRFDIAKIKANKDLSFADCGFPYLTIYDSEFKEHFNFFGCEFKGNIELFRTNVKEGISFHKSKINGILSLEDVETKGILFKDVELDSDLNFNRVKITNSINFQNAKIKNSVDLRRCNLDSLNGIYLENIDYPLGKFFIDWDQIKYRENFIIQLDTSDSKNNLDDFKRLQNIYENLIYNYEAQGNKISADEVRYELEIRRQELLGNWIHGLYGLTFGYGYDVYRLLILAGIIFILFSIYFYYQQYLIIYPMLSTQNFYYHEKPSLTKEKKWNLFYNYKVNRTTTFKDIPNLAVFWHCVILSASLLFGLRFKKEWVNEESKGFLRAATVEWILGIGLYFYFVLGIKTFRFDFIKGIFGL